MRIGLRKWACCLALCLPAAAYAEPEALEVPFEKSDAKAAQKEWAKEWKSPATFKNETGMEMVIIPPGEFEMGSNDEQAKAEFTGMVEQSPEEVREKIDPMWFKRETPKHSVTISEPFYMAKTEVTRGQFAKFVKATGYKTEAEKSEKGGWGLNKDGKLVQDPKFSWKEVGFEQTDEHPVINVTYNDAEAFCEWLSDEEDEEYRLPTEAEWEYACRGGTETRFYNGDDSEKVVKVGNVADASFKNAGLTPGYGAPLKADDEYVFTAPSGQFEENAFGLVDMHGNIWELCDDWFGAYSDKDQEDPEGPKEGANVVSRGGGWGSDVRFARSSFRNMSGPGDWGYDTGFRVVSVYDDDDDDDSDDDK